MKLNENMFIWNAKKNENNYDGASAAGAIAIVLISALVAAFTYYLYPVSVSAYSKTEPFPPHPL